MLRNAPPSHQELVFAHGCAVWLARQLERWAAGRAPSPRGLEGLRNVARRVADVVDRGAVSMRQAA